MYPKRRLLLAGSHCIIDIREAGGARDDSQAAVFSRIASILSLTSWRAAARVQSDWPVVGHDQLEPRLGRLFRIAGRACAAASIRRAVELSRGIVRAPKTIFDPVVELRLEADGRIGVRGIASPQVPAFREGAELTPVRCNGRLLMSTLSDRTANLPPTTSGTVLVACSPPLLSVSDFSHQMLAKMGAHKIHEDAHLGGHFPAAGPHHVDTVVILQVRIQ